MTNKYVLIGGRKRIRDDILSGERRDDISAIRLAPGPPTPSGVGRLGTVSSCLDRVNLVSKTFSFVFAESEFFAAPAHDLIQGCHMVRLQTKNPNLGKFWGALDWKMLVYFMFIWNILQSSGRYFIAIW
jgi:hypothetical protein